MGKTYVYHYDSENGWTVMEDGKIVDSGPPEQPATYNSSDYYSDEPKPKSKTIPVIAITILIMTIFGILYSLNVIPHRQYSNEDFGITPYRSSVDKDNDGTDDQTDILQSAKEYLATNPKYESKYYATGYPDDEYGVCTDVIAFALKGAGYDLMELVDNDARANPTLYDIETIDKNIDFRRVKNLEVYFRRHAQNLTADLSKIAEWQGGDIVIFEGHIGIISDKRNKKGIPFLIHHYSPFQTTYEEDSLENHEILGHYRIS